MNSRIPHGSPAGFEDGCRTRSACPNGELSPWLSCAEASVRRRSDYRMWRLPLDQPIPRHDAAASAASGPDPAADAPTGGTAAHGTLGGYRRGCHVDSLCPHWGIGRITCAAARRKYIRDYRERRFREEADSIDHGTPTATTSDAATAALARAIARDSRAPTPRRGRSGRPPPPRGSPHAHRSSTRAPPPSGSGSCAPRASRCARSRASRDAATRRSPTWPARIPPVALR